MSLTILRVGLYRFFFYSVDRNEPPLVHSECDKFTVKIWRTPTRIQYNRGFRSAEIRDIIRIVEKD
jgi:hypothetical protein